MSLKSYVKILAENEAKADQEKQQAARNINRKRMHDFKLLKLKRVKKGKWKGSWKVPTNLADYPLRFKVVATDVAGNRSSYNHVIEGC